MPERETSLRAVRAVCFDAVGTLIVPNPPAHVIYAKTGAAHGSRSDLESIRRRFAQALAEEESTDAAADWRTSEERERRRWRNIVAKVLDDVNDGSACFDRLYRHFQRPEAWRCAAGTARLLDQLAQCGYSLALASNYDHRLRTVVDGLAELRRIEHLFISSEIGWRKPSPRFFAAVCEGLEVEPQEILFVGDDRQNDYEAAKEAGMKAVLVEEGEVAAAVWRASGGENKRLNNLR